jgi:penicillin-binding protein 2
VNLSIGQGFLLATPLQIVNLYAALARGGEIRNPVLVEQVGETPVRSGARGRLPASPDTLAVIRRGLEQVVSDPGGTGHKAFRGATYTAAAKTGSAETEVTPTHAWFAAYAPAESPEVALVVLVEQKGHGGDVAAPLARRVLDGWFSRTVER